MAEFHRALWNNVLAHVGPMFCADLQKASQVSLDGPNKLTIRFPPGYGFQREHCQQPTCIARVEEALRRYTRLTWQVRVERDDEHGLNCAVLVSDGPIEHDGLRFRSRTETRIYDALKRRNVLFFPNAAAVLGGKDAKREPDFLICQAGKWGVLEVMGERHHPSATADHDRARLFKDYGLSCVEFYDAGRCYNHPDEVVEDLLARLARF
jgi:hypothetical protein